MSPSMEPRVGRDGHLLDRSAKCDRSETLGDRLGSVAVERAPLVHREELACPFDAFELVRAAIREREPGAGDEIAHLLDTRISFALATAAMRAAVWTAMPRSAPLSRSTSPVCTPARASRPSSRAARSMAPAHFTALPGPSKWASRPSPAVSTSTPP